MRELGNYARLCGASELSSLASREHHAGHLVGRGAIRDRRRPRAILCRGQLSQPAIYGACIEQEGRTTPDETPGTLSMPTEILLESPPQHARTHGRAKMPPLCLPEGPVCELCSRGVGADREPRRSPCPPGHEHATASHLDHTCRGRSSAPLGGWERSICTQRGGQT
jgi:hypothetical protein